MSNHGSTATPHAAGGREARFDRAARERHADALVDVSPLVRSRLQRARQQASLSGAAKRSPTWAWAGSAAVLALALVIGVQFQHAPVPTPSNTPLATTPAATTDRALAAFDNDDTEVAQLLAALDENPDFYLWLAANDGALSTPMERYP